MRALTDEQQQAVARRSGSLLLAAGAGSGKTSVLVERFVRAVLEDSIPPGQILAITFTERSAGELRERIRARFLQLGEREAARDSEGAFISTFHGFCARLLGAHPLQAGVEPGFQILEEGLAARLRIDAFSEALAGFLEQERPAAVDLVAAYGADPLRATTLDAYAQLRSQDQSEPRLPAVASERGPAAQAVGLIDELLERFGAAYAQRKHTRVALDFDDLELCARTLLDRREDVREAWAERLRMLMVDEFQDTNPRQLAILTALERDNLFTVGDELQSIYGFRHADVQLFRERHGRLDSCGSTLALTRNFRSRPSILGAVQRIFAERMGERFVALEPAREDATTTATTDPPVELLLTDRRGWERLPGDEDLAGLAEATPWRQAEARLLAARIAELIAGGEAHAGEVVVLLRALGDLPVYESALRRHGLPTLAGVGGFWGHQQVGDLLAWLRALANPLDELALYSALASPLVGLSSDGLALLGGAARTRRRGLWETIAGEPDSADEQLGQSDSADEQLGQSDRIAEEPDGLDNLLGEPDRRRLLSFRELFAAERSDLALHPLGELIRRVLAASGYEDHVRTLTWGERRMANVHKLIRLARHYEAHEGRDLRGFLDHAEQLGGALGEREPDAPVPGEDLDAVRLMSIHAAKGLEFEIVCVADLGRAPNSRLGDLLVDAPSGRVGLRLIELGENEATSALDYEQLSELRRQEQAQEEERILYVACTRARERLLLSGTVDFARWPQINAGVAPIAWLAPALVPDAPRLARSIAEGEGVGEGPSPTALTVELGAGLRVRCALNAAGTDSEELLPPATTVLGSAPGQLQLATNLPSPVRTPPPVRTPVPPRPLADPDATMSYTALTELERCGYRYYVERVLRLPEHRLAARGEDDGGIEARARGSIVHALLEAVDFRRPTRPSAQDAAQAARLLGLSANARQCEQIAALTAAALDADPAARLARAHQARAEHTFAFSLSPDRPLVTGVLDLIVSEGPGLSLIVDYKSDRLDGGEDLERLVRRDYGFQRMIYALAAIEDGAREVEVAHWFLERPHAWVAERYLASGREHLRSALLERIEGARSRGFAVTQTPHREICLTCPARGSLCSWGETHTMGARSATLESER